MSGPRLYGDLAEWWPLISAREEYAGEAEILRATFREFLGDGRHTLLDLGVGGGHHLSYLTCDFDAVGVDLSPAMLAHARRQNPEVEHHVGDMRTVRLGRMFDAVLIHDAVAYLLSEADLRAALTTARAHLRPGGVLVMCPDWFRETFPDGFVSHATRSAAGSSVTYIEFIWDPDPGDSLVEIVMFLLIRAWGRLRIEQDRHTMGLFSRETWMELTSESGFEVHARPYIKADYGEMLTLIVGVRGA